MIETYTRTFVDFDVLEYWLQQFLKDDLPGKEALIINQDYHCNQGSRFFASVDADEPLTKKELLERLVLEHSRGNYVHFYIDDVIKAAYTSGALESETNNTNFNVYAD